MTNKTTRRDFVKATAATGAAVGYWGAVARAEPKNSNEQSPNERIRFASIGVGGKGSSDSADAFQAGQMVALCDVDRSRLDAAARKYSAHEPKKYTDFRVMLEELGDSIDAVTVSTPDHTHAVATSMALKMGIACYTQKPLTHTVYEARYLADLARKQNVATQMGNQGTAGDGLREGAAIIASGALGELQEAHIWTNRPVWAQGGDRQDPFPAPPFLDWDVWLGPAPERPFTPDYHPFGWRGWWDFGTGALGDMACHTFNMPFMALGLKDPSWIQAESAGHNQDSYPKWSKIEFFFPATETRPALKVFWYDGGQKPDPSLLGSESEMAEIRKKALADARKAARQQAKQKAEQKGKTDPEAIKKAEDAAVKKAEAKLDASTSLARSGAIIVGSKGKLYSPGDYGADYYLLGDVEMPEIEVDYSPGHFDEFVRAIKGGPAAVSNFPNYGGPLTETILLGNLAVWAAAEGQGKKIEWDSKTLTATNAPEVMHVVKSDYRKGWTL